MTSIKTGVDKLVELISQKKRISVDEASKSLGVGKDLIQEWAEFLEEEGVVMIEYKLSTIWINEKRITRDDVINTAKEVMSEKEAFSRKIDVAITSLEKETLGFEDVRREFTNIQSHIKSEIDTVKTQLSELERYDSLKKNLDKEVFGIREKYGAAVKEAEDKLQLQAKKYDELKTLISKETKNVDQYSIHIEDLKKVRQDYEKSISSLKLSLKNIEDTLANYKRSFDESSRNISQYKESLRRLDVELSARKDSSLLKKFEDLKSGQSSLLKNQQDIASEIKTKAAGFDSYSNVSEKIHKSFEGFFSKNINTEKLINEIEKEKEDLIKELEELKKKVLVFDIVRKNDSVKSQIKEIEDSIKSQELRRKGIKSKIEKLVLMIKGNK